MLFAVLKRWVLCIGSESEFLTCVGRELQRVAEVMEKCAQV